MADDITRTAPIPGLGWRDASRDREGGGGRSPFRRHHREAEADGERGTAEGIDADDQAAGFAGQVEAAYRAGRSLGTAGHRVVVDETSVMGVPATLMTPRIQEAISALMTEMDGLRGRLAADEGRVRELSTLAEGDGVLPVLNRWALIQSLDDRMATGESGQCLIGAWFYLENFEALRRGAGLDAALSALTGVTLALLSRGGLGDLVGTPGGAALVVARSGPASQAASLAEGLAAWALARRRDLMAKGHPWSALTLPLRLETGLASHRPGEGASAFLARLEQAGRDASVG
jgi:hypothetical protein